MRGVAAANILLNHEMHETHETSLSVLFVSSVPETLSLVPCVRALILRQLQDHERVAFGVA